MKLGSRLVVGIVAGIAGTLVMTAAMRRLHARPPGPGRDPLTPHGAATTPPDAPAQGLALATRFACGAAGGAILAAARPRPRAGVGAAFGGAVWLTSHMGWTPALGPIAPATGHRARRNALMIASHFIWGAATASVIRELGDAHETIFAAGEDRDRHSPTRRA